MTQVEVLWTPRDYEALPKSEWRDSIAVVFDVLRATSTLLTALHLGARAILPVKEIREAIAERQRDPSVLLAGERNGLRIDATLASGIDFDFGNSPREFGRDQVRGRDIVMTTTNGTRALQACREAHTTLVASFGNINATAGWLEQNPESRLYLLCSGTGESTAWEDVLGAGALWAELMSRDPSRTSSDSARLAQCIYETHRDSMEASMAFAVNARRLKAIGELAADIPLCLARDSHPIVAGRDPDGWIRRWKECSGP